MNLHWMVLSAALVGILGYMAGRRFENRNAAGCAVMLAFIFIMARGYYWNIFGRGDGFFTANRMSALALLLLAYWLGNYQGVRVMFRERRQRDEV